jgi:hypothetical protein
MKNVLFLLFTFNCIFIFGQTHQSAGLKVEKTAANLSVKWTNETGGVSSQKATCKEVERSGACIYYKCTCATGDYFLLNICSSDNSGSIRYYNELDSQYSINGKLTIFLLLSFKLFQEL